MRSSLSCSVFGVKRLLVILPAAVLLTSCTVMDIVGPRANGEIMTLARQASADQFSLDDAAAAELRATQSSQLVAEAQRLCGTDDAGNPPSSCDVSFGDTDLPAGAADVEAMIDQVRAATVTAAGKVPEDSVDLVVSQAIDTVAIAPVEFEGIALDDAPAADLDSARDMLRREYALEYGIGLATAWADDALLARIDALRSASDARREALTAALEPTGDVPQPLAGYEFAEGGTPTDPASAAELVQRLNADLVTQWHHAAAGADDAQWRDAAIRLAAHAQRA